MSQGFQFDKILELLKFNASDPLVFSTSLFFFLFAGFLLFYTLMVKHKKAKLMLIILFSLYFYYRSAGYFAGILVISAIVNFFFGKLIFTSKSSALRKLYLILAVFVNLGILGYFKYSNFVIQIINDLSSQHIDPIAIFLPIGISFYTFKALSYVFDIYMEMMEPTKSFRDFCVFVFFFPNILAGPIDRASAFLPQVEDENELTKEDIGRAVFLICLGLIKKVIISDYISLNFIDRVFDFPTRYTGFENLIATYGYTLQLYCDFSGYSDMAIGVALLMGYKLMDNFNNPFKATSVADFWRRWHISLSKWLLDYLFKPLQIKFRRLKTFSNVIGLMITFLICGLWHGAGWNFILWGALHGFYMAAGLLLQKPKIYIYKKLKIYNTKPLKFVQTVITFHLIAFSFLIFRLPNFEVIESVLSQIFTFFNGSIALQFLEKLPLISALLIIGFLFHFTPVKIEEKIKTIISNMPLPFKIVLLAVVIFIAAQFKSADLQPFIYFQF